MVATNTRRNAFDESAKESFSHGQIAFLLLLFSMGSAVILATIDQSPISSVVLFGFVAFGGLLVCRRTQLRLNDPALSVLGFFWLIKLGMTIFLLIVGWMPQLDPASSHAWGYDPQRFYVQAQELVDNEWAIDFVSLNYVGILYYYGAIYYIIGHNPVIPALVNAFVTLLATLYLIRVGYEIKGERGPNDWTLALAMLLPELLWFDVMTSRETLLAALLLFTMLTSGRYLARTATVSPTRLLVVAGLSGFAIAAVRTSMLLPVFASMLLMALLIKVQEGSLTVQRVVVTGLAAAALVGGPVVSGYLGGYDFDVGEAFGTAISAQENIASSTDVLWTKNSIGLLLMPEGLWQAILYLPARMVLYLVSPLPNVLVPAKDLIDGSWAAWQSLFTMLSSIVNLLAFPYAFASLIHAIKTRSTNSAYLVFHIPYWVTFIAIAGGNLVIHERYRVMASLLLWGCAWLGARTCTQGLIARTAVGWYGLLFAAAIFYLGQKFS